MSSRLHELLGTSLVLCPGILPDGRYAVVDVLDQTVAERSLRVAYSRTA